MDIEVPDQLLGYLRKSGRIGADETPRITVLAGGVSNRTVLVERADGEAWVLKQALEKLRVQVDWFCSPDRIHREALGMRRLAEIAPAGSITPLVFEDFAHHLLAMGAVAKPHANFKDELMAGRVSGDCVRQFGEILGAIHQGSRARRAEFEADFADRSFFESLRLEPYYSFTAKQVPEAAAFLSALIDDTRLAKITVVHGDYSPKNVLIHAGRLVLLDHEVIHFGDGAFDIGFAFAHFLSKAPHFPSRTADYCSAALAFWQSYARTCGDVLATPGFEPRAARHALGCLLARVAGRSTLEYLDQAERQRQRAAVLALMQRPPARMLDVIQRFLAEIDRCTP
jgi:aminoglycoside phosphotransferase (APT) family kinase protein